MGVGEEIAQPCTHPVKTLTTPLITHELAVSSFLSTTNVHLGIKSPIHVFAHTIYPMPQTKRDAQLTDLLLLT